MDNRRMRKMVAAETSKNNESEEVSSIEWEYINMTDEEEDLIYRMHRLVGDRWGLIAGRIPGRKAEEIERFWIMKHGDMFAEKRRQKSLKKNKNKNKNKKK
ncbi:Myb family transcription factor [Zostera marina]|uniref:Myb family transcription factor n=1 Tax=Zostera marina TaxID=29655 RepID=A0A0K9P4S6_ZOSMR|nr:Myb family transcription factor [Zostera marina]